MSTIQKDIEVEIKIDPKILEEVQEEGQVVVHCSFYNDPRLYIGDIGVRVWKETFLIDEKTGTMNQMVKAIGIVYQPHWYYIKPGETKRFTMLFDALPKDCTSFTLAEIIPQSGAFVVNDIARNDSDIYAVKLA